jgi:hypothetical protein
MLLAAMLLAAMLLAAMQLAAIAMGAQAEGPNSAKRETKPEGQPERRLVRLTAESPLYLYENERLAPKVAGPFPKGTVLVVLDKEPQHGFRRVGVLGGMRGFVYGRFLKLEEGGFVRSTGEGVAFRYQPKPRGTVEPPVALLSEGTRLRVLGEVDPRNLANSWVEVLCDHQIGAFAPASLLEEAGELSASKTEQPLLERIADAELRQVAATQVQAQQAAWQQAQERIAEAQRQRARASQLLAELRRYENEIPAFKSVLERKKAMQIRAVQPKVGENKGQVAKLQQELGALELIAAGDRQAGERILAEYERLELMMRAAVLVHAEPEPIAEKVATDASTARLPAKRRFDMVGWLRFRPGGNGPSKFQIVKGDRVIAWVDVPSGRYDLREFSGAELGVRGTSQALSSNELPLFSIERLVILTSKQR